MKTVKYKFSVKTNYLQSTVSDELELDIEDNLTEEQEEEVVEECLIEWMHENTDCWFEKIED